MANNLKLSSVLLLAVAIGATLHGVTTTPKGYAAPQSQSTFKQILLQSKDRQVRVEEKRGDNYWSITGKLSQVGDDFIEVVRPSGAPSNSVFTYYPFTSIQQVEKSDQSHIEIWLQ